MPELERPWILLVAAAGWLLTRPWRATPSLARALPERVRSLPPFGPRLRWFLRGVALLALALVAAGPQGPRGPGSGPQRSQAAAIMIALDVSESMREERLGDEGRLDAAIAEAVRFASARTGDRIGLVVFAGDARTVLPPARARGPLLDALERVRRGEMSGGKGLGDGTALGTAIALAANRLRPLEATSRLVVVVTDGESNAGALDPVTATNAAAALGVRVYALGVGDEGTEALQAIAQAGLGKSFRVEDRSSLDQAYRAVDALERSARAGGAEGAGPPRSGFAAQGALLWAALLLLTLEGGVRGARWGGLP